jgi:orotidine-5'-phosphate decarboxylase
MRFIDKLTQSIEVNNSLLCVGLDPDIKRIPIGVSVFEFLQKVVDETHDLVCAYKPQIAYFAAYGWEADLEEIITYIHTNYPGIPVILDAKRGDIGSTADQYAHEAFERY